MTGGVAVRADPGALADLAHTGSALVESFGRAVRSVAALRAHVVAGCGARAAIGGGLEQLDRLVAGIAETADLTDGTRRSLLSADDPFSASSPTGGTSLGPVIWPSPPLDDGGGNPWFARNTDSWVVGLVRAGATARVSPELLDRLRVDGPTVVAALTDTELSTANQIRLLTSHPDRFVDNWWRASEGAGSGVASIGATIAGVLATAAPGGDDTFEMFFGRRPGEELGAGVVRAGRDAAFDPDSLVESALGWELYRTDPYRWFGTMIPEAVAEAVTAALPVSPVRRALSVPVDLSPGRPRPIAGGRFPDLAEFRRAETGWAEPGPVTSHRAGPFESPEGWIEHINGEGPGVPGRANNCVDCARATEANWRGDDAVAAPVADPAALGIPPERLEDWAGAAFQPASIDDIHARLTELGPGSSAIITSVWDTGGAHAYNAVNDAGTIRWLDGQAGQSSVWPPPYADHVDDSIVIYIGPDGNPR